MVDDKSPAGEAFIITPSDSSPSVGEPARGVIVSATCNLNCLLADMDSNDTYITIPNLAAGVVHPLRVSHVKETGTTESVDIIGVR